MFDFIMKMYYSANMYIYGGLKSNRVLKKDG